MSREVICPGYRGMQNLMPVLPAIPRAAVWAAAAFPRSEGGWGEVTCPIPPKPFLLISLLAGTLLPNSLDHRPPSSPCTADLDGETWWKLIELFLLNSLLAR